MNKTQRRWTREELILTLSVYFQLPFGRLNSRTPEVMELARIIGRTSSSAALRLVNFAACDPYIINLEGLVCKRALQSASQYGMSLLTISKDCSMKLRK